MKITKPNSDTIDLEKYNGIVFDLFNTLTFTASRLPNGFSFFGALGVSQKDWNLALQHFRPDITNALRGIHDNIPVERIALYINPHMDKKLIRLAEKIHSQLFHDSLINIDPKSLKALAELKRKGKKLGLISNAYRHAMSGWEKSPLKPYFNDALFSFDVGLVKPEIEIYLKALGNLELTPGNTLYVGDGANHELEGAKKVGLTTVLTTEYLQFLNDHHLDRLRQYSDFEINSVSQIL